ncbi:conserved hypothetical protein, partial [Ricinus communis]
HVLLGHGHRHEHRIAAQAHEAVDAQLAVRRRDQFHRAALHLGGVVAEQRYLRQVLAGGGRIARAADQRGAVAQREQHRAAAADVEVLIVVLEVVEGNRSQHHAAEGAVRLVEAPAQREDPLAGGTALHRSAHVRQHVVVLLVVLEILAVGIVVLRQQGALRADQPAAVVVIEEDAVQLRQFIDLVHQLAADALQGALVQAVLGDVLLQHLQHEIGFLVGLVGMLGQRLGHVGGVHRGFLEQIFACLPGAPAVQPDEGKAGQHHEYRGEADGGSPLVEEHGGRLRLLILAILAAGMMRC